MAKYTKWFHSKVKPVRVGVYMIMRPESGMRYFRLWDGKKWHWGARKIENAVKNDVIEGYVPVFHWLGLAEEPK